MYVHNLATNGLILVPTCTLYNVSFAFNIHFFYPIDWHRIMFKMCSIAWIIFILYLISVHIG